MSHDWIEDEQIVERYVLGTLPSELGAQFEEHYLGCAECLERLRLAERFQSALGGIAAEDAVRAAAERAVAEQTMAEQVIAVGAAMAWWQRLARSRALAWAVVALLAVPLALVTVERGHLGAERDALATSLEQTVAPRANTALVRLDPERSTSSTPSVRTTLTEEPEWVVLVVAPGAAADGPYRGTLAGPGGVEIWSGEGLVPDGRGMVTLGVHSRDLERGVHRLRLEGVSGGVAHFAFEVMR